MKDLQEMKKAELQAVAKEEGVMYGSSDTAKQILAAIEKHRSNGKQGGAFKMLKTSYEARKDARISKEYPVASGELKIKRETHWNDERNERDESLIFFHVGSHPDELLIFSGVMVAAAEKAGIELFTEIDGELFMNDGFLVSVAPRKFAFDVAK